MVFFLFSQMFAEGIRIPLTYLPIAIAIGKVIWKLT